MHRASNLMRPGITVSLWAHSHIHSGSLGLSLYSHLALWIPIYSMHKQVHSALARLPSVLAHKTLGAAKSGGHPEMTVVPLLCECPGPVIHTADRKSRTRAYRWRQVMRSPSSRPMTFVTATNLSVTELKLTPEGPSSKAGAGNTCLDAGVIEPRP